MKYVIAFVLISTLGLTAHAKNNKMKQRKKAAIQACIAEGKVNAKGKAQRSCIKAKMKRN